MGTYSTENNRMKLIRKYSYGNECHLRINNGILSVTKERPRNPFSNKVNWSFKIGGYEFSYGKLDKSCLIDNAWMFSTEKHREVNHIYDGKRYDEAHLSEVVKWAYRYLYLIPEDRQQEVIAACWLHDTIEDCRVSYNDVRTATNRNVAEIVFALTNDKGRNRMERAGDKYYSGIRDTRYATFVKLCDRLANVEYGLSGKDGAEGHMLHVYRIEHHKFLANLKAERVYEPLVRQLKEVTYGETWSQS
jgi:hypothetical protein